MAIFSFLLTPLTALLLWLQRKRTFRCCSKSSEVTSSLILFTARPPLFILLILREKITTIGWLIFSGFRDFRTIFRISIPGEFFIHNPFIRENLINFCEIHFKFLYFILAIGYSSSPSYALSFFFSIPPRILF